ncbi:hypothetical protein FT643_05740 [Ketobacter sp. MCCC 1A13808]|uniref:immunoglobulin domain-containing protein n=1 Tax=Ketobacter sp. MCCC 1A13808 TaxID=2602738 RepID=UPI000F2D4488|nr:immunoglobulin domain-containing protein [Ketobacter sp. MCCC 1A13808]MVF11642.1 hypothetical protein [Ketobacter sp. MCCC 1A13808]RLP55258.1 MAG: hypothetical protein D6160_05770 [Ketobacter sp.]
MSVSNVSTKNVIRAALVLCSAVILPACGGGGVEQLGAIEQHQSADNVVANVVDMDDAGTGDIRNLVLAGQPVDVAVAAGQSHTFSVNVEHTHPITVMWYKNDSLITTSNTGSYGLSSVDVSSAGEYSCVVTDGVMTVDCMPFELSVTATQQISITEQPDNQMVSEGMNVALNVSAQGSDQIDYQWYFNGQAIAGATSRELMLNSVTAEAGGDYYVVVTGSGASVQSSNARLTVAAVAARASALIQWEKPTERENGSELDAAEIAGYEIFYAESAEADMEPLASMDADSQSYLAKDLTQGTHYFALQTIDESGLKSERSAPLVVTIN